MHAHSYLKQLAKRLPALCACLFLAAVALPLAALDPRLAQVNDWLYVLQYAPGAEVADLAATSFDGLVVDYSLDGTGGGELTPADVATLHSGGKVVLAYLSIGEAESYRYYWDAAWNTTPPAWLGPENPDFAGNFKVRYWDPAWKAILFGTSSGVNKSFLDRIIDQGFDGVYLDIIDAFTFWADNGERTRAGARTDMINLVSEIATYSRVTRGVSNFLVFPQNGSDIVVDDSELLDAEGLSYLATIDGIGVEDVFYNELTPQPPADTAFRVALLAHYLSAGGDSRLVLSVDYVWDETAPLGAANAARHNDYQSKALAEGYVPYSAARDRALDNIIEVTATGGFTIAQPKGAQEIFSDGFESGATGAWSATVP